MALKRKSQWIKRLKRKQIISLGLLLVTIFLSFFLISTVTSPSPVKEVEKFVKNDAAKRKTGKLESLPTNSKRADGKVVYLTFDDGPSSATDDILETLKKHDAKATFFMLSPHMKERPNVVKQVVKEGHGVGIHGVTHDVNRFYLSKQTALSEMNEAQKALESITGIHSVLIRTPYGSVPYLTKPFREALNAQGYELWDWNIDSNDWDLPEGEYVENLIEQIQSLEGNDATPVVLLHDQSKTAKYLPELLSYLTKQGFLMKKIDASVEPVQFNCYDRCHRLDAS
ncbi:polysaccharide deacetylase family protein [Virgibacillus salexigens]|uniref:polysaccharide deacetylase family protein n=1 Tax=Virgibacillus salexigens TaxID=61016 RepID=UPI0019099D79|nr:polysaccharide deacetylase family protein [Virgibacillus salexigens]